MNVKQTKEGLHGTPNTLHLPGKNFLRPKYNDELLWLEKIKNKKCFSESKFSLKLRLNIDLPLISSIFTYVSFTHIDRYLSTYYRPQQQETYESIEQLS